MRTVVLAIVVAVVLAACGAKVGFNDLEKAAIGANESGVMRVLSVDNHADSAFLRRNSLPMDLAALQSAEYAVLRHRMLATVQDSLNPGVGIAAPQVGISRCMIAVQRFDKQGEPFEFYLNPEIVAYSDQTAPGTEGCLSVPNLYGEVVRSRQITLRYCDEEFAAKNEVIEGFTATIFQHEIDHLHGILYTDRMEVK